MGQGYAGVGGSRHRRGHAGHHLEGDARLHQDLRLLSAPAEDKGVAALQSHDALALDAGLGQQQGVDLRLLGASLSGELAHVYDLGVGADVLQEARVYQAIVDHHLCRLQQSAAPNRNQLRVSGARSYQVDLASH